MSKKFEDYIMPLGVNIGMLAYNDNGYINHNIQELLKMFNNGADKIQLKYYINRYINLK